MTESRRVILASASATRARLLTAAGVAFEACPSDIDEAAIKDSFTGGSNASEDGAALAHLLARAKAAAVSARNGQALVIGADQVLICAGRRFDRAGDPAAARRQLLALQGRHHHLHTAVVLMRGGELAWRHEDSACLTMRALDEAAVGRYLAAGDRAVLAAVGSYALEGIGAQLFDRVQGDYFTILGLPLLPLLGALREQGVSGI